MPEVVENEGLQFDILEDGSANLIKGASSLTGDLAIPAFIEYKGKSCPVVSIEKQAFYSCEQLASVYLPDSIKNVRGDAFLRSNLERIEVAEDNPNYRSIDGVLFNKDVTCLIYYPSAKKTKEYILPGSVDTVARGSFRCDHLKKVFIPSEVRKIEKLTFVGCEQLEEIIIVNSSVDVWPFGFHACRNLKHLVILETHKHILNEWDSDERMMWKRNRMYEREDWLDMDRRREILRNSHFRTWAFKDCHLQNVFIPADIYIRDGYFKGFGFSFHHFEKLFRYKIEPEYDGGRLAIEVRKSHAPDNVWVSAEINVEYQKDMDGNVSVTDYHCTDETEQEENLEQVKYLLNTLSKYGRI